MELANLKTRIKSIILCWFVLSLNFIESRAQLFPVQVTPQLVPPYSVYLSDYAAPGSEKLRVIVLQRDLTQPSYQLRLVMNVELNGKVIMRTAKAFYPLPLNIDPGVPTIISGADLAPYVDSRNIDFVGFSREQYERTRALPEGSYRIIFTAYDYRRQDVQVSNEGSSFYYLSKNEPPLINFPACGTAIQSRQPQQIVFSWLPRNTSSPTSAADTEYEFSLYETRPITRNPNDVINTTQPIFKTRTDVTTLVYGPSEPQLFDDMKYVWRVQAIDKSGRDAFRNHGYTEVCTFAYGGVDPTFDIGVVKNLQAVGETERRAKISWEASNYDGYKVYYKKTGAGYEWFWSNVTNNELTLFGLEPDTEYETRVQVKKSGVFGPYSEIVKFRTQQKQVIECGQEIAKAKADESKPLLAAQQGMTIMVDDMNMTLVNVRSLGAGWFEGIGTVAPKILGRASFYVQFKRLFIDENLVAGFGRIDFITKGVAELVQQQMANAAIKDQQAQQHANRDQWSGQTFQEKIFKYDEIIADVQFDVESLIITDSEGNTSSNSEIYQLLIDAPEKAIIIEDKTGDQWVVQKDPNGDNKITKEPGGGLVVGPDGRIVNSKALRKIDQMILDALNKFKKAIEDYQASIKQTQPGKGGGPCLFEDELHLFWEALPACLAPQKENLTAISSNIDTYRNFDSEAGKQFKSGIYNSLTADFPTLDDKDNASVERVENEVCEALVVGSGKKAVPKGKLVLSISDTAIVHGKVYILKDTVRQLKVKFEISDTTKTKVTYQLVTTVESPSKTINYPKTGFDTLVYNQVKEITLDSVPQGKYTLVCKTGKVEHKMDFFIRRKKLEITTDQLKAIFPKTDGKRIEEVVKAINANSSDFDITTPERMAHFIGQIGTETAGLNKLKESFQYPPRTVVKMFPYPKYGHLFEVATLDSTTYTYSYSAINYDENNCGKEEIARGNTVFPLKGSEEVRNAYGATKTDSLDVTLNKKKTKVLVYKLRTDINKDNIDNLVAAEYNDGLLKVKSKYIRSAALFDVTYACRMQNGNVTSKDGSTYLGKGFIHITGKGGYKDVSIEWNKIYPDDKKEFHGKDINLLETDIEVAIKASMVYWKLKKLNGWADNGTDDSSINDVGEIVNGSDPPNGADLRRSYTKSAYKAINIE